MLHVTINNLTMDLVSDALIRIKNGYMASKNEVILPYSKLIAAICGCLNEEGYIAKFKQMQDEKSKTVKAIKVTLKYENKTTALHSISYSKKIAALTDVKRISKPGLRVYKGKNSLPWVLSGLGVALISTPKGVMTDREARKQGVGGEILAYVW